MTDTEDSPSLPLRGITALITGAAGKAGQETARALSLLGANLHLADTNETALVEATRTFHQDAKGGIKLHVADTAERVDMEALSMDCEDADVLVHLAGDFPDEDEIDMKSDAAVRRAWNRRVFGAENLTIEMSPDATGKTRILFLLPLLPEGGGVRPRMANAALKVLAEHLSNENPAITTEAKIFDDPDAIAARILGWVKKES